MLMNVKQGKPNRMIMALMLCFLLGSGASAALAAEEDQADKAAPWMIAGAVAAFDDDDARVKALALDKLVELKSTIVLKSRVAGIAQLLRHQERKVRLSALRALGEIGDAAKLYTADIIRVVAVDDFFYFYRGMMEAIANIGGSVRAVDPVVVTRLRGEERASALAVLSKIGRSAAIYAPEVAALLKHENNFIRINAVEALAGFGKAGQPYISALLRHRDVDVRRETVTGLRNAGKAAGAYAEKIAGLIQNEDSDIRSNAITALAIMGDSGQPYFSEISSLLRHRDANTRSSTISALDDAGVEAGEYAEQIAELLKDNNWDVRSGAISALGDMGDAGGIFAAEIAEQLKYEKVRWYAESALERLNWFGAANKALPVLGALVKEKDPDIRKSAFRVLNDMGAAIPDMPVPAIAVLLKDVDQDTSRKAKIALWKMGKVADSFATNVALLILVDHWRGFPSAYVMSGMNGADKRKAAPIIAGFLKDKNPTIRWQAGNVLVKMAEPDHARASLVASVLKDVDPLVRYDAVALLGEMGETADSFAPDVAGLLNHDFGYHQTTAIRALGKMGDAGKAQAHRIAELLLLENNLSGVGGDKAPGSSPPNGVYEVANEVLADMGPFETGEAVFKVLSAKGGHPSGLPLRRFLTHFLSGGKL